MPAIQAFRLVQDTTHEEDEGAINILLRLASTGDVSTRYRLRRSWEDGEDEKYDERDGFVTDDFWHRFYDRHEARASNWKDGYFLIQYFQSPADHNVALYGVDFDSDELQRAVAPLQASVAQSAPSATPASPKAITRAPSVKAARPPSDSEILAKADEMRDSGMKTYDIAQRMRLEPGFENVATRSVRELIKGRYPRPGRSGIDRQ